MWVYILESLRRRRRRYAGMTVKLQRRLDEHNGKQVPQTARYAPWRPVIAIWFADESCARDFEKCLKSGSGHAFSRKRFWRKDPEVSEAPGANAPGGQPGNGKPRWCPITCPTSLVSGHAETSYEGCLRSRYRRPLRHSMPSMGCLCQHEGP